MRSALLAELSETVEEIDKRQYKNFFLTINVIKQKPAKFYYAHVMCWVVHFLDMNPYILQRIYFRNISLN